LLPSVKSLPLRSFFHLIPNRQQLPIAATAKPAELPITADSCQHPLAEMAPIGTYRQLSAAIGTEINFPLWQVTNKASQSE
jgi:hypothetical protein